MVEQDLSTEAADAIEVLLQDCQNGKRPSVQQIQDYMELADELREDSQPDYEVPSVGRPVHDAENTKVTLKVVSGVVGRADHTTIDHSTHRTVADANPMHPEDAPVVKVTYPGNETEYHYPVTRLEW